MSGSGATAQQELSRALAGCTPDDLERMARTVARAARQREEMQQGVAAVRARVDDQGGAATGPALRAGLRGAEAGLSGQARDLDLLAGCLRQLHGAVEAARTVQHQGDEGRAAVALTQLRADCVAIAERVRPLFREPSAGRSSRTRTGGGGAPGSSTGSGGGTPGGGGAGSSSGGTGGSSSGGSTSGPGSRGTAQPAGQRPAGWARLDGPALEARWPTASEGATGTGAPTSGSTPDPVSPGSEGSVREGHAPLAVPVPGPSDSSTVPGGPPEWMVGRQPTAGPDGVPGAFGPPAPEFGATGDTAGDPVPAGDQVGRSLPGLGRAASLGVLGAAGGAGVSRLSGSGLMAPMAPPGGAGRSSTVRRAADVPRGTEEEWVAEGGDGAWE